MNVLRAVELNTRVGPVGSKPSRPATTLPSPGSAHCWASYPADAPSFHRHPDRLTGQARRVRLRKPVIPGTPPIVEGAMALRCVGIDPGTNEDKCPAVFVDTDTGDFVLV